MKFQKVKICRILLSWGGFGDALVVTPSIKALKEKRPDTWIVLYCPHNQVPLFRGNPNIDLIVPLFFFSKPFLSLAYILYPNKFKNNDLSKYPLEKVTAVSVKKTMGEFLGVKVINDSIEIYLSEKEDQWAKKFLSQFTGKTVTLHVTSEHSKNNGWDERKWNELIRTHEDITFIQVGLKSEQLIERAVDARGDNLRRAISLVKHADSFVGVESFFGHVTNAFNKKGVVLFADSSPMVWGHKNNINIYKTLSCSPCYTTLSGYQCPYGKECRDHSVQEVSDALIRQLNTDTTVNTASITSERL